MLGEAVIVGGGERGQFSVVDGHTGRIVARISPLPRYDDAYARSPDSAFLYLTAFDGTAGRQLIAIDTRSLRVSWREQLSNAVDARLDRFSGLAVYGDYGLAASPEGDRLFVANAYRGDMRGIAALNSRTRDVVGFVGPLYVEPGGLVTLRAGAAAPQGAILVLGRRDRDAFPVLDWLFLLDSRSLELRDSVAVAPARADGMPTLVQVLPAPDGRHIYVGGTTDLYKYDLVGRQIVASTARVSNGHLVTAPDGRDLYMTDPGDSFDSPGSGFLYVFGPDLQTREAIDLRGVGGIPRVIATAAVSPDGKIVYVSSGTASRGPLFGVQPLRVLVVDVSTKRLLREVSLDDWSPGPLFLR